MTVETSTSFDIATFKRAYESWDIDAVLELYADELELIQIDRDNPPSAPRTRQGRDVLKGMLEHCAAAGVVVTVDNTLAGEDRAAVTITCEFPGGRCSRTPSSSSRTAASSASSTSCRATRGERERDEAKRHRHCRRGRRPRRTVGDRLG
jgi:SnoaL-like domain